MLSSDSSHSFTGKPPVSTRVRQARQVQFDVWLSHRLRDLYDPILNEPLPDDLIDKLSPRQDDRS